MECPECNKVFYDRASFEQHMKCCQGNKIKGKKDGNCSQCLNSLKRDEGRKSCVECDPSTLRPESYQCVFCARTFESQQLMENHVKSVHQEKKILDCPYCDQAFRSLSELVAHYDICHGELSSECDCKCNCKF